MRNTLWVLAFTTAATASAQQGKPDWKVRLDRGHADASLTVSTMPPGWHVTTGKSSGIFYDPAWKGAGSYRVEATVFLFPDSRPSEGYGVFLGGSDLEADGQRYLYVLLRRDGRYLIKLREGATARDLVPWTAHAAIRQPGEEPAKNVLAVAVGEKGSAIEVNGEPVTTLERAKVPGGLDGQVGLRLNHGVNLHVTSVKVAPAG